MTKKEIEYILAIDKERNISKAADSLGISQPYLSQFLSKLEDRIGFQLFDRSSYPIHLTQFGEAYLETARKISALERDLEIQMNRFLDDDIGNINIGSSRQNLVYLMPVVLREFYQKHPNYTVNLFAQTRMTSIEKVKDGSLDFSFASIDTEDDTIECVPIKQSSMLLAVPASWNINTSLITKENRHSKFPLIDLKSLPNDLPWISGSGNRSITSYVDNILKENGIQARKIITTDSSELSIAMVSEGLGVSLVPSVCTINSEYQRRVFFYSLNESIHSTHQTGIFLRKGYCITPAVKDMIDLILKYYV